MRLATLALTTVLCCIAAGPDADKGKILGLPSAPIRIDVYSDFSCPSCKNFHDQTLPMIVRDYVTPGKAYIVSHEYPLTVAGHEHSREAANYATAAARLGIYHAVADAIFRDQQQWVASGKVWDSVASVLNPEQQKKVQTLAKDPAIAAEVQRDVDAGNKERVNSTPTIFVTHGTQHVPVPYPVNYTFFRSLLNGYLK